MSDTVTLHLGGASEPPTKIQNNAGVLVSPGDPDAVVLGSRDRGSHLVQKPSQVISTWSWAEAWVWEAQHLIGVTCAVGHPAVWALDSL